MPPQLADDGRKHVGDQLDVSIEVEAVDRLDQPDRGDLDEIVELLAAPGVPSRERPDERHEVQDQVVAGLRVAVLAPGAQKRAPVEIRRGCRSRTRQGRDASSAFRRTIAGTGLRLDGDAVDEPLQQALRGAPRRRTVVARRASSASTLASRGEIEIVRPEPSFAKARRSPCLLARTLPPSTQLDGELQVVDGVERQIEPGRDTRRDEPRHAHVALAGQRDRDEGLTHGGRW